MSKNAHEVVSLSLQPLFNRISQLEEALKQHQKVLEFLCQDLDKDKINL